MAMPLVTWTAYPSLLHELDSNEQKTAFEDAVVSNSTLPKLFTYFDVLARRYT
ncbi:hypothetical protein EJ08DRAFT_485733 [Tothia fuscella]|uniref:Uncharacterized protein n=1 Tax=Tothia fuscella TaxID=1048955 RepID=A0A9P4NHL5_9PEZI|nr:hypothetical protein EJ08DRAFT_485733 [Tothia fuscella]